MANRAQRRANAKNERRGIPSQYDQTRGRGRSGMIDEHALQERSSHLQEKNTGEWKPSSNIQREEEESALVSAEPAENRVVRKSRSRDIWRKISWSLIILSIIAFVVLMWLPNKILWAVIATSCVFAVGVLSLFFVGRPVSVNESVDKYGTAV